MGIPERAVEGWYENCDVIQTTTRSPWSSSGSPSGPFTTAAGVCVAGQLQQQQQQQQHQQQHQHLHPHHQQQQHQHQHQHQYERPLPPPPPPYPGHSKQVFGNMPGFRQSYSGSDTSTDMSLSSTENLAVWPPRQDSQGDEISFPSSTTHTAPSSLPPYPLLHHYQQQPQIVDNSSSTTTTNTVTATNTNTNTTIDTFSMLSRLQRNISATVARLQSSSSPASSASSPGASSSSSSSFSSSAATHSQSESATSTTSSSSGGDTDLSSSGGSGSEVLRSRNRRLPGVPTPHHHHDQHQQQQQKNPQHQHVLLPGGSSSTPSFLDVIPPPHSDRYFRSLTPTYHHPHPYVNVNDSCCWARVVVGGGGAEGDGGGGKNGGGGRESAKPNSCASPSQRVLTYVPFLPPPPEYPGVRKDGSPRPGHSQGGQGRCNLSDPVRSFDAQGGGSNSWNHHLHKQQQQLSARDCGGVYGSPQSSYVSCDTIFSALKSGCARGVPGGSQSGSDHMLAVLSEENRQLQQQLGHCHRKITKLQKLEQEIQHVQEAYQSLVRSTDKWERLESAIKSKLQDEVQKLQSENGEMKVQLQNAARPTRKLRSRSEGRVTQTDQESGASLRQLLNNKHLQVLQLESQIEQWELRYSELQTVHRAGQNLQSFWCDAGVAESSQTVVLTLSEDAQNDEQQHAQQLNQSQHRIAELEAKVTCLQTQLTEKEEMLKTTQRHPAPPTGEKGVEENSLSSLQQQHQPPHHHHHHTPLSPHHRLSSSLPTPPTTTTGGREERFQTSCSQHDLSTAATSQQSRVQLWQV